MGGEKNQHKKYRACYEDSEYRLDLEKCAGNLEAQITRAGYKRVNRQESHLLKAVSIVRIRPHARMRSVWNWARLK